MKSLLISSIYFPPQVGGISHFMGAVASALGPEQVCCLTGAPVNEHQSAADLKVGVYRRPSAFRKPKYRQAMGWALAVSEIMIRERPVLVQLASVNEGYLGLWLQRWLRLPFVVYAYGNEILDAIHSEWDKERCTLQEAERILAISRFTAELVQQAGAVRERIEIVHPGCDVNRFRPVCPTADLRGALLGSRASDRVILTVGNLVARKGHDMVIRALPRIRESIPDVTYVIVGDGPHRNTLEALAASTGVRDRVVFAGRVRDEQLPEIYALCDVFVMPSREQVDACDVEGFGLVFIEANACGKPVVGGRSGGVPDAIVDGVTGFLVDPRDPDDISAAVVRLLSDRGLAASLGQQGRLRAVRDFDWAGIGNRIQGILESVLSERSGGRQGGR